MTHLPQHPFGTEISLEVLSERLSQAQGWEAKNRLLVQLARELATFPAELRDDAHRIAGCESQVWLYVQIDAGLCKISADSDSKIIKGLLALILAAYNHKTTEEVRAFDFPAWLNEQGLQRFLSASRGNGLKAIVNQIKTHATS